MYIGQNFRNGHWYSLKEQFEAVNPSTLEVYGRFPKTPKHDVENVVESARQASLEWRRTSRVKRAEYFDKLAQLIKRDHENLKYTISMETGKNLNEAHAEVIEALHMCQYAASSGRQPYGEVIASELSTKDAYVIRKPRGVVAIISPWNFPLAIGSFWSAAPSLVEGNTVVHKPSELTPMINQITASLYQEAGFPDGVFNLIHGDGETGAYLVESDVDVILFTGSSEVGQLIRQHCANTHSKTCSIECGSKSSTIIFEDGDLNLGVTVGAASNYKLSGQRCVSSGRLLIQRSIFDEYVKEYLSYVERKVFVGDPIKSIHIDGLNYGPMISKEQMDKVQGFNQLVRDDNDAEVLYDPDGEDGVLDWDGHYLRPFVYKCEWGDKPFLKNEVFGPHVALVPFDDLDDAIRIYNDTDYGLALGVVTDDYRKHRRIAQECTTGMLYINGGSVAAESHLPFSSWKKSGYGTSAAGTYKAVTHTMAVTTNFEEGQISWAQGMK